MCTDPTSAPEEFFVDLKQEFTGEQIIDLCFFVWITSGGNAFNAFLDLVPETCEAPT